MASSPDVRLHELQDILRAVFHRGLATQSDLATASSVDQAKVSLALRGKLKVWNPATERLMGACRATLGDATAVKRSSSVAKEIHNFYANGGTDDELAATIAHVAALIAPRAARD